MTAAVFLVVLLGLILLGMPVAFALAAAAIVLALVSDESLLTVAKETTGGMNNFALLAVPFYLLLGELMNRGSLAQRLVRLASAVIGWVPGGLGHGAVASSMFMGGISGSAIADASAVGGLLAPPMQKEGYSRPQCGALIGAASVLGIIIPPSIPMVLYGIAVGDVSIADMFIGGLIPGVLLGGLLLVVVFIRFGLGGGRRVPFDFAELGRAFAGAWFAILIPVVIVVGIYGGIFTPTEAGAAGSAMALVYSLGRGDLRLRELPGVFITVAQTTAVVMFLVGTASAAAHLLTKEQVPAQLVALLHGVTENPLLALLLINVLLLVIGCVMDLTPALLILAPLLAPVAKEYGYDPVFFGVMMCINLGIGLITPPVGTILYIMAGVVKVPMDKLIPATMPYLLVLVLGLMLLIVFPGLVTWLPAQLNG